MEIIEYLLYIFLYPGLFIQALDYSSDTVKFFSLLPFKNSNIITNGTILIHAIIFRFLLFFIPDNQKNKFKKVLFYIFSFIIMNGISELALILHRDFLTNNLPLNLTLYWLYLVLFLQKFIVKILGSTLIYYILNKLFNKNNEKK